MTKEKSIELNTRLSREDVAGILEALSEGLKEGVLKVQKSGDTLELVVPRFVDLEIEAEYKEGEASFEIEVSWRPGKAEVTDYPGEGEGPALGFKGGHISDDPNLSKSLKSAEEALKQTAASVGAVAKAASKKASKALTRAAGSTLHALEKAKVKTKQTVKEIKEEAERISAEKKAEKKEKTAPKKESSKAGKGATAKKSSSASKTKAAAKKTAPEGAAEKTAVKKVPVRKNAPKAGPSEK